MILKILLIYFSAHYPHPVVIHATVTSWDMWGSELPCVTEADRVVKLAGLEPPARQRILEDQDDSDFDNDDPTAMYFYTCTLEAQL